MLDQANMTRKSTFTYYKQECASVKASLNACNGNFVWSPNGPSIGQLWFVKQGENPGKFTITEYEPQVLKSIIKCRLGRFCMIIQDSNLRRLWHVRESENNQEVSQSQIAN